jgi:hypothetical protein
MLDGMFAMSPHHSALWMTGSTTDGLLSGGYVAEKM